VVCKICQNATEVLRAPCDVLLSGSLRLGNNNKITWRQSVHSAGQYYTMSALFTKQGWIDVGQICRHVCVGSGSVGQYVGRFSLCAGATERYIHRGWATSGFILWPPLSVRIHRLGAVHALCRGADPFRRLPSPRPGLPVDSFSLNLTKIICRCSCPRRQIFVSPERRA
jgi:hypothetical protein